MLISMIERLPSRPEGERPVIGPTQYTLFGLLAFLLCVVAIAQLLMGKSSNRKNIIGSAKWAGPKDKRTARNHAIAQLQSSNPSEVALWINSPPRLKGPIPADDHQTIYLPDAPRGISVIGGSGSGKSFSVVRPTLRAAIAQDIPVLLLDTDYPGLAKTIAPLADSLGYDVSIFAPGYPESQTCNILDFIGDCTDATGASQLAKAFNKNFSLGNTGKEDPFFQQSGELLTTAILLLTKALPQPDVLSSYTILKDADLIDRLRGVGKIHPWLALSFGQLMSVEKSEKTASSILGTAAVLFGQLMRPDILPALTGTTTIPLNLSGKKLLIFGVKQEIRLAVSPLIASIIHALVMKNVVNGRREPLFLSLDEVSSMYFPELGEWLAEKRKYGLCTLLGYQSLSQLKGTYGPNVTQTILTNTSTKFLFNPQSPESAKVFSDILGGGDIVYKTRSRTPGKTSSVSEHRTKRPLLSPEEFQQLNKGSCVLISPAYGTGKRRYIPLFLDPITLTDHERQIEEQTEAAWPEYLKRIVHKGVQNSVIHQEELTIREREFQGLLPIIKSKTDAPLTPDLFAGL